MADSMRTEHTVQLETTRTYLEALRARDLHAVASSSRRYIARLREEVQARAEQGLSAAADVLPVEAQLASADVALIATQASIQTSLIDLQIVMGVTPDPGFQIVDLRPDRTAAVPSLTELLALAQAERPDLKAAREAAAASRSTARAADIALYPRPVVSVSYAHRDLSSIRYDERQIQIAVQLNTLDGGVTLAAAQEARVSVSSADLRVQQTERRIQAEVEQAMLRVVSARQQADAADLSVQAATMSYSAQLERYKQGLNAITDVLNAESQMTSAQSSQVQALYDLFLAQTELAYATGRIGVHHEN